MTQSFEIENRPYGDTGAKRPFIIATCSACRGEEAIADSKGSGAIPLQYAQKLFSRKGWELGSVRSKDICPSCARARKGRKPAAQAVVLKGESGPIPADPDMAETAIGAKLIEAALVKSNPAPSPAVGKVPQPVPSKVGDKAPTSPAPTMVKPPEPPRAETPTERIRRINQSRTPEERSALAKKGIEGRRERQAREAEIKRLAQAQEVDARREKMGRGIKQFWANLTAEQRSERARVAAATLAAKRAAAKAGIPFIRPTPLKPAEIAQAKVQIARATSAAKKPQEPVMTAVAPATQTKTAEPPRQATREQNLKILEKLHEVYDTSDAANPHYIKTYTDKQVAEELKFPAAWIGAVRDQFFGPEKNEAAEVFIKDVIELKAKQADLQARFAKHFEELTKMEDEMRRINDAVIIACRRAGVPVN